MTHLTLSRQIATLLRDARANHDRKQKLKPARGLTILLYVTPAGEVHLMLTRTGTFPAPDEWKIVMAAWPESLPTPRPTPAQFKTESTYCLSTHWRTPAPEVILAAQP